MSVAAGRKSKPYVLVIERHGGVGDVLFTTPIIRYLRRHGIAQADDRPLHILFATQKRNHFLLENLSVDGQRLVDEKISDCFPLGWRLPHKRVEDENYVSQAKANLLKLKPSPDAIITFFEAIERNDAANHENAYDWHFKWIGVDPVKLKPADRLPQYSPRDSERQAAERLLSPNPGSPRIGVQMHASSLPRTWDKFDQVIIEICRKYPHAAVYSFGDPIGQILEPSPPERERNYMPLSGRTHNNGRLWAAAIGAMDLFISVDTGAMHIAGALGVPVIGIFSTVPGWTRIRDYRGSIAIDSNYECAPCFRIGMECAKSVPTEGWDFSPSMNIRGKNSSYPCLASISVDDVMARVEEILGEKIG